MNFGNREPFHVRHQHFFTNFKIKFDGVQPDVKKKKFEDGLKSIGITIDNDSSYIFCHESYPCKLQNKTYYSLDYLLDSLKAKKPLDFEKYRIISKNIEDSPCCSSTKHLSHSRSCKKLISETICCEKFLQIIEYNDNNIDLNFHLYDSPEEIQNQIENNKPSDSDDSESEIPNSPKSEPSLLKQTMTSYLKNLASNSIHHIQSFSKSNKKRICSDDLNEANIKRFKSAVSLEASKEEESDIKILKIFKNKTNVSESKNKERFGERVEEIEPRKCKELLNFSSSGNELSFSDVDDYKNKNSIKDKKSTWWFSLPPPDSTKRIAQKLLSRQGQKRGATFTLEEQQIMITYLIITEQIYKSKSRKPWFELHAKGYLTHRSVESISNNFRKIILKKIDSFGLPEKYVKQFKELL